MWVMGIGFMSEAFKQSIEFALLAEGTAAGQPAP